jgi:hypothetical protein
VVGDDTDDRRTLIDPPYLSSFFTSLTRVCGTLDTKMIHPNMDKVASCGSLRVHLYICNIYLFIYHLFASFLNKIYNLTDVSLYLQGCKLTRWTSFRP